MYMYMYEFMLDALSSFVLLTYMTLYILFPSVYRHQGLHSRKPYMATTWTLFSF